MWAESIFSHSRSLVEATSLFGADWAERDARPPCVAACEAPPTHSKLCLQHNIIPVSGSFFDICDSCAVRATETILVKTQSHSKAGLNWLHLRLTEVQAEQCEVIELFTFHYLSSLQRCLQDRQLMQHAFSKPL